jgi:hypothetical protein
VLRSRKMDGLAADLRYVIRPADVLAFAGIAVRGFLSLLLESPSRGVREFTFQGYPIRRLSSVRR